MNLFNRRNETRDAGLALREIRGNLTVAGNTATAWYLIAPQRWGWLPAGHRTQNILDTANALAVLVGHRIHIRVTDHPYPAFVWAENLDRATQAPLPGWRDHRLKGDYKVIEKAGLSTKEVYLGVEIPLSEGGVLGDLLSGEIFRRTDPFDRITERVETLTHSLSTGRLQAIPATGAQMEWLMHRSIALGLPAPAPLLPNDDGVWELDELHELADRVEVEHNRMADTVKLRLRGTDIVRYVTVLTMSRPPRGLGRPGERDLPWMALTEVLDFPVEWSVRMGVMSGQSTAKKIARQRLLIHHLRRDYATHKLAEPGDLAEKERIANALESEMNDSHPARSTRTWGYIRLAVSGTTAKEAVRRAERVATLYNEEWQWRVVPTPPGQYELYRSFIPGEPFGQELYLRRMGVQNLAAGAPWAQSDLGDNRGPYLGDTGHGVSRPVMFDPHFGPEVQERSGLTAIIGEQGSGKSALIGRLAADAAERGIKTTILDPSGPLAKLCTIGHLAPYSLHLDLASAHPGTLNPYSVIPDPVRAHYDTLPEVLEAGNDPAARRAVAERLFAEDWAYAIAERKQVVRDVIRGLLEPSQRHLPETAKVIGNAIRSVPASPSATLWDVMAAMENDPNPAGRDVANLLRDASELPLSRLYFTEPGVRGIMPGITEPTLVVITMPGLILPAAGVDPITWDDKMRTSVVAMNLATMFATKRAYAVDRLAPKMLALDEAGQLAHWEAGVSFVNRLARDTRKYNIAAIVGSQNPEDLIGTGDENPGLGIVNLASAAFVGRMHDKGAALNALRLLGVPQDAGLAAELLGLSPLAAADRYREFVLADQSGNVGRVRIELSHRPQLLAALRSGVKGANDHRPSLAAAPAPARHRQEEVLAS